MSSPTEALGTAHRPEPLHLYLADSLRAERTDDTEPPLGAAVVRSLRRSSVGHQNFAVLGFIAASVNGLQETTLCRCLRNWIAFQTAVSNEEPVASSAMHAETSALDRLRFIHERETVREILADIRERWSTLLHEVPDDDSEGVTQAVRHIELNSRPLVPPEEDVASPAGLSLQFQAAADRSEFIREWTSSQTNRSPDPEESDSVLTWNVANHVLAEESLRQATVMVRQQAVDARENANSVRKFAQAVFHGLAGVTEPLPLEHEPNVFVGVRPASSIPLDPVKRYRYLYLFVYQHCIEGDDWRLGRSLGRSDVRLDILTMFLAPGSAPHLLISPSRPASEWRFLPGLYEPEPDLPIEDRLLRCELIQSLGRAGLDSGSSRGRYATRWALSVLPGWVLEPDLRDKPNMPERRSDAINAKLPSRQSGFIEAANSALKLRIDWLQSLGRSDWLGVGETLCLQQLERSGLPSELIEQITDAAWRAMGGIARFPKAPVARISNSEPSLEDCLRAILRQLPSPADRKLCADILFRLAEILATKADNLDGDGQDELFHASDQHPSYVAHAFASTCAVYWIADRLRSSVGRQASSGLRWPMAGARSLRYYVRSYLKLARLLVERGQATPILRATGLPEALLEHAQSRLAIFTRHHFGFFRERVSAQLLESARIRSWVRIEVESLRTRFLEVCVARAAERLVVDEKLAEANAYRHEREHSLRVLSAGLSSMGKERTTPQAILERQVEEARDVVVKLSARSKALKSEPRESLDEVLASAGGLLRVLDESSKRIDDAERLLLSLGFQRHHVIRLFLERAKFASTLVRAVTWTPTDSETRMAATRVVAAYSGQKAASMALDLDPRVVAAIEAARKAVQGKLVELATASSLSNHLRLASWVANALKQASAGDLFWSTVARRQQTGLGLTLLRASEQLGIDVVAQT